MSILRITKATVYDWIRQSLAVNQRVYYSSDVIHVSEVSECLRKAYYTRTAPLKPNEAALIIMSFGNGLHNQLQEYLVSQGWKSEVEVSWNFKYFRLIGHIDLYNPTNNTVLEIKTTNKIPDNPYPNHVMQLNSYQAMIKAEKGYLIYISRNGQVEVFPHRFDKRLWKTTIKRAFNYYFSLRKNRAPKPEPSPLCTYCPFKWKCYRERGDHNYGH